MYNFSTDDQKLNEAFTYELVEPEGDLEYAQELAQAFDAKLVLTDEQGFQRGWVHSDGDYSLS